MATSYKSNDKWKSARVDPYLNHLIAMLEKEVPGDCVGFVVHTLKEVGIIDLFLCRCLAVREYVKSRTREGGKLVDAMFEAAYFFGITYECVRKYWYYYKDVNLPE